MCGGRKAAGPPESMLRRISSVPKRYPFGFACFFTSFKSFMADVFVQKFMEDKKEWNVSRSMVFGTFGFLYQGAFQYVVYIHLVAGRLLPNAASYAALPLRAKLRDRRGGLELLAQVGIANLIMDPMLCLPTYYITKEAILEGGVRDQTPKELVANALNSYRSNCVQDVLTSWKIWVPAQLINFGLMPLHLRVPFISVVSFGYCVVLSVMRGPRRELPSIPSPAAMNPLATAKE